ncbi:hypothetical protein NH340_JMT01629 [Sarcoptes scabiei]|nr:hypothetical protein NH340_JMT01629 [Sarcoptes scabiei]
MEEKISGPRESSSKQINSLLIIATTIFTTTPISIARTMNDKIYLSDWRMEFLKCTSLNYGLNVSKSIIFCNDINRPFCCHHHRFRYKRQCCSVEQFFEEEIKGYLLSINLLQCFLVLQSIMIVVIIVYIGNLLSKLSPHICQKFLPKAYREQSSISSATKTTNNG